MPDETSSNVERKVEFRNKGTGVVLTALSLLFLVLTVCVWPTERLAHPGLVRAAADRMARLDAEIAVKAAELAQAQAAEAQPKQGEASGATPQPPQDGGAGGPAAPGEAGKAASEGKVAVLQAAYDKAIEALASEKARHDKFAASRTTAGLVFGFEGESLLLFIVIFTAALGGSLHALKSFAYYQAKGDFNVNYGWWYFARIPVASILGLITYFALRGGVFPVATTEKVNAAGVANPHGIAAISALVGMYSGRALRKLGDVFDAIMGEDDIPGSKPDAKPAPAIASVSKVKAGATTAPDTTVTVKLKNLDASKLKVAIDGKDRQSTSGDDKNTLKFDLTPQEAAAAGKIAFSLRDEAGTEYKSEVEIVATSAVEVIAPPTPGIASVSTVKAGATGDGLTVTVTLTALDATKLEVLIAGAKRASKPGDDKKSLTFELTAAEANAAGKIPFSLRDEAGKEYKSEVVVA